MQRIEGRVAVVTGAGSGIGRATSVLLAERGCDVAVVDVDPAGIEQTAASVRAAGRSASTHVVDVADAEAMAALPAAVLDAHGSCHILVNNAGVTTAGRFEEESLDDLRWIVGVNVWGVLHGCKAFLPLLRRAERLAKLGANRLAPVLLRPPEAVARRIVRAVERNQARTVVGPDARLLDVAARLLPGRAGLVGRAVNRLTG